MIRRLLILLACVLSGPAPAFAQNPPLFQKGDRVLCLGDSITMDGRYLVVLDLLMRTRLPEVPVELIPLGLASETVSGASEKHHPWPRPDVHERAARALEKVQPSVVMFCYGMNDGIYAPPDEARFAKYQAAVKSLVALCRGAGVRQVVILTPPPFDAASVRGPLAPDGFDDYGYQTPWKDYNTVLAGYAAWLKGESGLADRVIDLHTPLTAVLAAWHRAQPEWSSGDGVHPVAAVHWLMGGLVAEGLGVPGTVADLRPGEPDGEGAWRVTFSAAPPIPPPADAPAGFFQAGGFRRQMNLFEIMVPKAGSEAVRLKHGDALLGMVTRENLARGLDLSTWQGLPLNQDAAAALPLALERHRILSAAWREHVGHKRPDTDRKALPLAEAQAAAAKIEEKLNGLLRAREDTVTLEPVQ